MPSDLETITAALADRYQITREIGRGGMATVYLAQDFRHHSRVAVKVLRPEFAGAIGTQRFTREVQITAGLQHPHILPLLDSGEAAGQAYYVMPFVEGESLGERLAREAQLPVDEAVRLTAEVADGLGYAHEAGFIHRDIKPGNILLSHGHAVIADFGIAHALEQTGAERLTQTGIAIGTGAYMSPEQASGGAIDARSDIYALGCVLYEMLAGTPPFSGTSARALMARHAIDPVPSVRTVRGVVPPALEAAIVKSLAKAPQDRFATVRQFRDEIVRAATGPVTAESAPVVRPVQRRTRWVAAAFGLVAVIAVFVQLRRGPQTAALDHNRVIVYPLVLSADWSGARTAGEDVATLIGSAMDGAGALRWVDGWQRLTPAQRENVRLLGVDQAMALARTQHCAYAITGRLVARGDSAAVFLELYDVRGDSVISRTAGNAAGIRESWRGGLSAVTRLLPRLLGGTPPNVEREWRTRPPQAVANFLQGEAAFRRVNLPVALASFRQAIDADSTFGLAAVRGAQVASWLHETDAAEALVRVALRQNLPPRYRHFARGFEAFLSGRTDSAAAEFNAAVALDSSMTEAWLQLGELYIHQLPSEGNPESLAEAAFSRARALDPSANSLLPHVVELAARRGDYAMAADLGRRLVRSASDTQMVQQAELFAACGRNGFAGIDARQVAMRHPEDLTSVAKNMGPSSFTRQCSSDSWDALLAVDTAAVHPGIRWVALIGLVGNDLALGRSAEAIAVIEAFQRRWGSGREVYLLAAPVTPALAERAREVARQDAQTYGPTYAGLDSRNHLWELGVWAARDGNPAVAGAVAQRLAERAARGNHFDSLLASSVAAHAALARGDSLGALGRFEAVVGQAAPEVDLVWNVAGPRGLDRLLLGRLLIWRGQFERAMRVLDVHDSSLPLVYPLYRKASLELRIQAATALNRPETAAAYRARLAAWTGPGR